MVAENLLLALRNAKVSLQEAACQVSGLASEMARLKAATEDLEDRIKKAEAERADAVCTLGEAIAVAEDAEEG